MIADTQAEADLETITDKAVYDAMLATAPAIVAAIGDLVKAGQTPALIEGIAIAKYGRNQTTRNVRHAAEHVARTMARG